jgi:hypothetical protein
MFLQQKGVCPGCERHQSELKQRFAVEHCHKTGAIRGLMCLTCNSALGMVKDSTHTLQNLINYLNNSASADNQSDVGKVISLRKQG